jgi:hypothetical protein
VNLSVTDPDGASAGAVRVIEEVEGSAGWSRREPVNATVTGLANGKRVMRDLNRLN